MRKNYLSALVCVLVCCAMMFCCVFSAGALDDKYDIDELGMSLKIPKEYTVITRESERNDEAFKLLKLDYDETMTAFTAANIYLRAVSEDEILKITLTQTSDKNSEALNNYSDLSSSERQTIIDAFLSDTMYTSGVEVKHDGNIYFDLSFAQETPAGVIYGYQCHTVINGMNINLTLQKDDEALTADEIKVVTNIANSIHFDKIKRNSGFALDWWRVFLWIIVLVAIALLAKYFYSQYNNSTRKKLNERKSKPKATDNMSEADRLMAEGSEHVSETESTKSLLYDLGFEDTDDEVENETFEEMLGYDIEDYRSRANTDLDTFDIDVKEKDPSNGVSYFEDEGQNIDDKPDYFEDYFSQETESRPAAKRAASSVALNVKLFAQHLGYFGKNVSRMVSTKVKNIRKKK